MAKSSLTYHDRERLEFLTSHLRGTASAAVKRKYSDELSSLIDGKDLTRSDIALAAYYLKNSGQSADDTRAAEVFADAYRSMPAE